jgi:hypothetical protein
VAQTGGGGGSYTLPSNLDRLNALTITSTVNSYIIPFKDGSNILQLSTFGSFKYSK